MQCKDLFFGDLNCWGIHNFNTKIRIATYLATHLDPIPQIPPKMMEKIIRSCVTSSVIYAISMTSSGYLGVTPGATGPRSASFRGVRSLFGGSSGWAGKVGCGIKIQGKNR